MSSAPWHAGRGGRQSLASRLALLGRVVEPLNARAEAARRSSIVLATPRLLDGLEKVVGAPSAPFVPPRFSQSSSASALHQKPPRDEESGVDGRAMHADERARGCG